MAPARRRLPVPPALRAGAAASEMHEKQRNSRRRHAGDAARLPHRAWPRLRPLLHRLHAQPPHPAIVDRIGQRRFFVAPGPLDLVALTGDVTVVAGLDFDLIRDRPVADRGPESRRRISPS